MALSDREWERIKILVSLSNFTYDYTNIHLKDNSKRKYLTDSLECHGGLKDMLRHLYENPDTRFIDMYKDTFSSTFGFHRRQILPDKYINTFNQLFMFLEAYRYNSNDFDNFNMIVDDILSCSYSNEFLFDKNRWQMIDKIISNTNYKNIPELSRFFKYVLTSSEEEFKDSYLYYRSMMMMVDNVLYNDGEEALDVANNIIKYSLDNYHREEYPVSVDLVYSDILLLGNRFSYLNNKLKEVEPNMYIRRDIFSRIMSFSEKFFNTMLDGEDDYLLKSLDIVFDSDTYTEMISKLNVLSSAGNLYDSGKFKEALEMVFLLDDLCHKETFNGDVVQIYYGKEKPTTIIERTADLYSSVDPSKSKESILNIHADSLSIGSLYVGIGPLNIVEEDKTEPIVLEKPKSKVKCFIDRFIPKRDI